MKITIVFVALTVFVNLFAINHPSLVFSPDKINWAKNEIKTDTLREEAWRQILAEADKNLERNDFMKCEYLALAFQMTGERKYAEKVKEILLQTVRTANWSKNEEMLARNPQWRSELQMAHKSVVAAIAYDAVYTTLSKSEKKEIAEGLYRLGVEPALGDWLLEPTRIHSLNSMGHNWWTSMVCMGGLLALSIENEVPEAKTAAAKTNELLPEWFSFAGDVLQNKPKTMDAKGGMYESVNYAVFGISEALLFRLAYKNAHPEIKLPAIPELNHIQDFFFHAAYPNSKELESLNFGDSHKNITAENVLEMVYALGQEDPNILWYLKQVRQGQNRDGYFRNTPIGFLYYPNLKKAPERPTLPNSEIYSSFGWGMLRSSWEKDATFLAVKSGHTWNHAHADANSFILYHQGVNLLKDAGNCWYPNPEYKDYFFQSQAHNVVLFNGEGQPSSQQYEGSLLDGQLSTLLDGGNIKYILANGTGPVARNFVRNFRHFLWIDNIIYMIDDLQTYENGNFEWLWHTEGEVSKRGYDLNVSEGNAAIAVRPIYPEFLAPSNFLHDYPHHMHVEEVEAPHESLKKTETYYSFKYPEKVSRIKGMTAIILKDSAGQKTMPWMEKIQGKDWIGLRVKQNGKITDIILNQMADGQLMHSNSWIWAEGWETDASILAISYPESGNPENFEDLFVSYGSALRRSGKTYLGSLSKLSMVQKNSDKGIELTVDGQPVNYMSIYSRQKPASLWVNRQSVKAEYISNQLQLDVDRR